VWREGVAPRIVVPNAVGVVNDDLLAESKKIGRELTDEYYREYRARLRRPAQPGHIAEV
jgi:hypothetical protein